MTTAVRPGTEWEMVDPRDLLTWKSVDAECDHSNDGCPEDAVLCGTMLGPLPERWAHFYADDRWREDCWWPLQRCDHSSWRGADNCDCPHTVDTVLDRKRDDEHYDALVQVLQRDGFTRPIHIHPTEQKVTDGHHRIAAALDLGLTAIPAIRVDRCADDSGEWGEGWCSDCRMHPAVCGCFDDSDVGDGEQS